MNIKKQIDGAEKATRSTADLGHNRYYLVTNDDIAWN